MSRRRNRWGYTTRTTKVGKHFTLVSRKRRAKAELHWSFTVPVRPSYRDARPAEAGTGRLTHVAHRCVIPAAPAGSRFRCDACGRTWLRAEGAWQPARGRVRSRA